MSRRLQSVFVFLLAAASVFAQPRNVKPGWNLFSKEQDIQLGREAAAQVEQQMPVVRDRTLTEFVNRIGQRLASTPEADRYPYTFKLINDQSINAFALPGGPTYVHTGLIRAADNEAQVAGVMAHEIAHVALRHGTHQASKANLIQLPAMLAGAVAGGGGSMLGQLAQLGIGLGANSLLLKYSRDAERDADILGARMMARAGYNPVEMARFFEKLEAQGGSRGPQFLSDHPNPGNRMRNIQEEIRYMPQAQYTADTGMFSEVKSVVGGMRAPDRRYSGSRARSDASADPRPSGRFRTYRSQTFEIAYPDNWEVFGDPQGGMVTIAPRAGIAQDQRGGTQVIYGVMASYYQPRGGGNLRQDTMDLINDLARTNPSLQMGRQQTRRINVDGQEALVTVLYSESPYQGETEHDTLITVGRPEGLFYLLFIAPASAAHQLNNVYDQMLRSLNFR
ncbi:MAG TPA: M48 family metallopeptidase [Bryobacteraceae bacterium]|nr:M48 family metallopeptidase [Bryobacteraceae bacterium]